ncbi:MAG: tetratricopeptide repeat protein [Spirochaetales bacterium]|nr:tetratricopeptide repeat protein [Spirochaetales bacterium]
MHKNQIAVFILFVSAGVLYSESADDYFSLGYDAFKEHNYEEAITFFEKAAELWEKEGVKDAWSDSLFNIGIMYAHLGNGERALFYYKKALAVDEEAGDTSHIVIRLNFIGNVYRQRGEFEKAIEYYTKALALNRKSGFKSYISVSLTYIGLVYLAWGYYDKALDCFSESLEMDTERGAKADMATSLNNIGELYHVWGQYEKALDYYSKALTLYEKYGTKTDIAIGLNNIGAAYKSLGRDDEAIGYYTKAVEINRELKRKASIAIQLNNIGRIHQDNGRHDEALDYFKKAAAIAEELGHKGDMAVYMNNIGTVYSDRKEYEKAIEYCTKAYEIDESAGIKQGMARDLTNIGAGYYHLKKYETSSDYLRQSIDIIEQLRLTAAGEIRRDYLASQMAAYQLLTSAYIRDDDITRAFETAELSRAKYLVEQMGERLEEKTFIFGGMESFRKSLDNDTAVISFANVNLNNIIVMIATDRTLSGFEMNRETMVSGINRKYKTKISMTLNKLRGITIKGKTGNGKSSASQANDFDTIVTYYRHLASHTFPSKADMKSFDFISRQLYTFLFSSLEKYIGGRETLLIIPDGVLAFLPFETLIMPDGRYMAEKHHITYTQSLTVSALIGKRAGGKKKKPLLAFGGAVYDEAAYPHDMIENERQLEYLKKQILANVTGGESTRGAYDRLGIGLDNLPGTLAEVEAIRTIIPKSTVFTGKDADESRIKAMSKNGSLKDYEVIHFATHGIVVPEIPELSAVVLSLFKREKGGEDGYLNMKEIAALELEADFINLSACETGLGKLYGGEGVVGLTQSFLVAGANGLSVSLWQVADDSTMIFMTGMYRFVREKGMSYAGAMTAMKREFIKSEIYGEPFYWAPFVYYGQR